MCNLVVGQASNSSSEISTVSTGISQWSVAKVREAMAHSQQRKGNGSLARVSTNEQHMSAHAFEMNQQVWVHHAFGDTAVWMLSQRNTEGWTWETEVSVACWLRGD